MRYRISHFFVLVMFCVSAWATPAFARADRDTTALANLEQAFSAIADEVRPSVVNIKTERENVFGIEDNEELRRLFPFFHPDMPQSPPRSFRQQAAGSGFVLDAEGHILTNNHLVDGATKVEVRIESEHTKNGQRGEWLEADIVGTDPATDLAVVKLREVPKDLTPAKLGKSKDVRVGQWAIAIGDPFGLDKTVTVGVVSAVNRKNFGGALQDVRYQNFIQTDASINPGNSGGPLVNLNGEVIGINTFIFSETGGAVGIGFAIPIDMAQDVVADLIRYGKAVRGFLGVKIRDLDPDMMRAMGAEDLRGALIDEVVPDTPADRGGLKKGDVVLRLDGEPIEDAAMLQSLIAGREPDEKVELDVLRRRERKTIEITLEEFPEEQQQRAERGAINRLGIAVQELSDAFKAERNLDPSVQGVIVAEVDPNSMAADKGLERGLIILEVAQSPVSSVAQFEAEIAKIKPGEFFTLYVVTNTGNQSYVALQMPDSTE